MSAYDGYRTQPEPQKGPHTTKHESHTHLPSSYDNEPQYRPVRGRSREDSTIDSNHLSQPSQQPLKVAIGNAFEKADAARAVDPDLIAQITEQVKKSVLEEIKLSVAGGVATQAQPVQVTPTTCVPPRDVYTPPSPKRTEGSSQRSQSPDPLARDPLLDESSDTATPRPTRSDPINIPRERSSARPAPAIRMATDDYTPIEKMWQRLFDGNGIPMPRLGQFLRGLALHLVEDYEPKGSLVISPAKMLKFYEDVSLKDETYPWQTIFGKLSYSALSKVYRDMRCQHHLIQEHPAEQPYIPALTPDGFQEWMTAMIQAYPDVEYERLAKAVLAMPISNADDRKERFPKELPRRLFPQVENLQAQQRCAANLSSEGVGPLRKAPAFPPPPPKFQATSDLEPSSVPIERQRKPYAATPGGGKKYEDDRQRSATTDAAMHEQRKRRQSAAAQGPFAPPSPAPTDGYYDQSGHDRSGHHASTRRARSPSFPSPGTQSDPNMRDLPGSYYTSNLHNFNEDPRYSKDGDNKKHERPRRSTVDSVYEHGSKSVYGDDESRSRHGNKGYDDRGYESRRY